MNQKLYFFVFANMFAFPEGLRRIRTEFGPEVQLNDAAVDPEGLELLTDLDIELVGDQWIDADLETDTESEFFMDNTDEFLQRPDTRVIVLPKYKLAFCWIEKNACTEFNQLFNMVNGVSGSWGKSSPKNFKLQVKDLTRENGWKWSTFLRDPVHRYASAFVSKCVQKEDKGDACEPRNAAVGNAKLKKVIEQFTYSIKANLNRTAAKRNPHYGNQIDFCGGVQNIDFDFVGLLEGNVHEQVVRMLEKAHVPDAKHLAEILFPASGAVHGHHSTVDAHKLYKYKSSLHGVKAMYEQDIAYINKIRENSEFKDLSTRYFDGILNK
eukprot:gnl/MRDRNA2_/MRDRNA2_90089_c0_seq1.p1 gnl/MRDRNA2_/MRDRNA2_90089_c0~~gnl/MRDRNA2_/MRDRNA2_90089_c0_seq1.p1  ORF type:complete len:324 (+),score=50.54 gnl/MRDRNA2_/MRDRNA2_90089_c0_seq1:152-1123(+)